MIERAARFAARAHEGKMRKGSVVPYIVHPLETAVIVSELNEDPEVIAAAILHDVIEDAGVSYGELEAEFGKRVADLVQAESEDKSRTWKERKQATIDRLKNATREEKLICLGDKLSNLRTTASEMLLKGDRVWEKFRETAKEKHEWYYGGILGQLSEFRGEAAYEEYRRLFGRIFGPDRVPER